MARRLVLALVVSAGCASHARSQSTAPPPSSSAAPAVPVDDAHLAAMFERGWTLVVSGDKDQGLSLLRRALSDAERSAGAPEGDRSLRSSPATALTSTHLVGDRVLVSTPFITLLADPSSGRVERVAGDLHGAHPIPGTSLLVEHVGEVRTRIIDGLTFAPVASWEPRAPAFWPSANGALVAVARKTAIVVFDTHERRALVEIPVPNLDAEVRFVDDGRVLVIGGEARDARSGRVLFSQKGELGTPAFAGSYVAFVAPDGTVVLADRNTWKPITKTRACAAAGPLAFDADGKQLAIGGVDSACVIEVPSLRVRRTHAGRKLPIVQHPEQEARLVNRMIPTFVGNGRVLALVSARTSEISLFDTTSGRELSHDVGELFAPEHADAYVVTGKEAREVVTIGSTGTVERRPMSKDEYDRHWRTWSRVPEPEVQDRIRTQLCFLYWGSRDFGRGHKDGWWVVPREACDR